MLRVLRAIPRRDRKAFLADGFAEPMVASCPGGLTYLGRIDLDGRYYDEDEQEFPFPPDIGREAYVALVAHSVDVWLSRRRAWAA
jgi:hypothetical protein